MKYLSASEAAQRLGLASSRVILRHLETGRIKGERLGSTWMISEKEWGKYLASRQGAGRSSKKEAPRGAPLPRSTKEDTP